MLYIWLKFALAALVVFFGGKHLTRLSSDLAETLGLTKGWVGLVVLALITSLPEAATSGAAAVMGNPDVSIGNILGSNTFNLTFIGVLALIQPVCLWQSAGYEQVLNAGWFIVLTLLVVCGFLFPVAWGGISLISILILMISLLAMRKIYAYHQDQERTHTPYSDEQKKSLYLKLFLSAASVIAAGVIVAGSAEEIAGVSGLSHTFVGSFFAAVVTSMPEATVSIHALKMGEVDMAIGNLLGSNLLNTTLLFLAEIFFVKGSIFAFASKSHLLTCAAILLLSGITLYSIRYSTPKSAWRKLSPWLMGAIYLTYLYFLA